MPIAIIPARGGSKRVPQKNIRDFHGRPLISYSIKTALTSGLFDKVIVSTDDEEIAEISRHWGAEVPFLRPLHLADDFVGTCPVLLHAINELEKQGCFQDVFCCVYATAPFLRPEDLQNGYELLLKKNADTVFSVTSFAYPIYRGLQIIPDGRVVMLWPQYLRKRSQDLPEAYHDAGEFYWAVVSRFKSSQLLFTNNSFPYILPRHRVVDIDTEEDWTFAEYIGQALPDWG